MTYLAEEPRLFECVRNALVFCYTYVPQHYDAPAMYRTILASSTRASGKGLVGNDGAGQSGMIRAELEQIPLAQRCVLAIKYAPREWPCGCGRSCCRGQSNNKEWMAALEAMTDLAVGAALSGCVTHYRARKALVLRAVVKAGGMEGLQIDKLDDIADAVGVHRNTVSDHNRRVREWVRMVHDNAEAEIYLRLVRSGMVEG